MIEIIKYNPEETPPKLHAILSRTPDFSAEQEATVREIVSTVRKQGDRALLAYTNTHLPSVFPWRETSGDASPLSAM